MSTLPVRLGLVVAAALLAGMLPACRTPDVVPSARVSASVPEVAAARWEAVILLRHAEKQSEGRDPELTAAGVRRADRVAGMLRDAGVTAVHATPYARTRLTAAPIAARAGVQVATYDPRRLEAFAASLADDPGRIVVVGHSNTTPAMVRALGGDPGEPIDDATEFDRLYVLTPGASGAVHTLVLRIPGD